MRLILILALSLLAASAGHAQKVSNGGELFSLLRSAITADDFGMQKKLIEMNADHVRTGFIQTEAQWCAVTGEGSKEALEAGQPVMQLLETAATLDKTYGTRDKFLLDRVVWLRDLKPEARKAKATLHNELIVAVGKINQAKKVATKDAIDPLITEFERLRLKAEGADDQYWAASCCSYMAGLTQALPDWFASAYYFKRGQAYASKGHAAEVITAWNLSAGARSSAKDGGGLDLELLDVSVPVTEARAKYDEALKKQRTAAPVVKGKDGKEAVKLDMPMSPNVHPDGADMGWEEVTKTKIKKGKPLKGNIPDWNAGAHWYFWRSVQIPKGQTVAAPIMPGNSELENDKGKLFLHPEGKGKGKGRPMRLKFGNKPKIVAFPKVKYPDGSTGKVWHEAMVQPNTIQMQGFQFRYSDGPIILKFRGATICEATVRGEAITVHDVDANGKFNDYGIDVVSRGKGRSATQEPLSYIMQFGGLFYEFKVDANGQALRTKPYDGPVAPLKVEWGGNKRPVAMLGRGVGDRSDYFINLVDAMDKPMWVLAGRHMFHQGYLGEGKGVDKRKTMVVRRSQGNQTIDLKSGELNNWQLGGAGEDGYSFRFKVEKLRESGKEYIRIPGKDVKIFGNFGEEYGYSMLGFYTPMVEVRKGKDGPIVMKEKMRRPERSDTNESADNMWFPKTFKEVKTFSGPFSVRLSFNYPPLGKITSKWIDG